MANDDMSDPSLCEIVIERKNQMPTQKWAKKNWYDDQRCEITEACVRDLGFSTTEANGEKKKSLQLRWGPKAAPVTMEDEFIIVPEGDHEIALGQEACDKWYYTNYAGSYPCFMKKLPEDEVLKKKEEDKARHAQQIAAQRAKWLQVLLKEQPKSGTETPGDIRNSEPGAEAA